MRLGRAIGERRLTLREVDGDGGGGGGDEEELHVLRLDLE